MLYEKEYVFAQALAKRVGFYVRKQQNKKQTLLEKGHLDFYTKTDLTAEKKIIEAIKKRFPHDNILAEESKNVLITKNRLWIIDPIDGTHQFAAGDDNYSIIIGFVDKNSVQFGVVNQPNTARVYHALRSNGAYCNKTKIHPTQEHDLKKLLVIKALWFERKQQTLDRGLSLLKNIMEHCLDERRYGSCGLDCCRVSSGTAGAYYEFGLKPWDIAGPSVIVEEAGGIITMIDGRPLNIFATRESKWCIDFVVSANKEIHRTMLNLLR